MRTLGIQILVCGLILTILLWNSHAFNSEKFKITHSNKCSSTETLFRSLYGKSLSECVFECNIRPKCAAINYRKRRIQCELLESSIATTFVPNSDETGPCVYIHRRNISLNASEQCGNNCTSGQVCDTNSGKCIIQECQPLSLANGVILGNMCNVGARLKTTCNDGFAEIGSNVYTVCNTAGQWVPAIRCFTEWLLVFRGTPGIGSDPYAAWLDGLDITTDTVDCMSTDATPCAQHYRDPIVDSWGTLTIKEVKFALYKGGIEDAYVTFNGTGSNITDWFTKDRVLTSSWSDIKSHSFNYFSIAGHSPSRRFFINIDYPGCPLDRAYTVAITSLKYQCNHDNQSSFPQFLYSTTSSYGYPHPMTGFDKADVMTIFIKV